MEWWVPFAAIILLACVSWLARRVVVVVRKLPDGWIKRVLLLGYGSGER